jgi:protein-tyrosine kinase
MDQRDQPAPPTARARGAADRARRAMRLTARSAYGAVALAGTSFRALRRSRDAPPAEEITYPDVQLRAGAHYVESIYQASVGAGARVVAVIGVEDGDGASACARALAERSALAPSRTLLVDASESRRPTAPTWEPEPQNIGWFKLSDGEEDPFRLRSPDTLRRLWVEAHKDWETVIIDCAPALEDRDYVAPGKLTARSADAVILVCLGGKTTKQSIEAAKAALGPANVVGVVVNGRDQPTVGAEVAREARRISRYFPRLSRWLARRALRSKALDVPA